MKKILTVAICMAVLSTVGIAVSCGSTGKLAPAKKGYAETGKYRNYLKELGYSQKEIDDKIQTIQDLVTGSWMEGVVTNVTQFGAFVDIGVHQDGLVHISEIGEKFVKNAMDVLKVGEVVRVRVKAVDPAQKRISLSMRNPDESERHDRGFRGHGDRPGFHGRPGSFHGRPKDDPKLRPTATIADLKAHLKGKDERPNRPVQAARPVISIKSLMRKGR